MGVKSGNTLAIGHAWIVPYSIPVQYTVAVADILGYWGHHGHPFCPQGTVARIKPSLHELYT